MEDVSLPAYDRAAQMDLSEIPVIDFAGFLSGSAAERSEVVRAMAVACSEYGFFYLINHAVPEELIDGIFDAARRFYEQPRSEREKSAATLEHWRGYVPPKLQAEGGTVAGSLETFRLMLDLPSHDPDVLAGKPLHLPNRWPQDVPGFRSAVSAYFNAMMSLSGQLRRAFAAALGLVDVYFEPFYKKPLVQLSLLHYRAPRPDMLSEGEIGAGEHRDSGAFTLLMQDGTGGLEVQRRDGMWVAAPPLKGAFVINIGDILMRWTNGRFVSTPHRVVNRARVPRYSVPFFVNPDYDAVIEPIPQLLAEGEIGRYPPLHNGNYMADFYERGMTYLRGPTAAGVNLS